MKIKECIQNGCNTFTLDNKTIALPITLAEFMRSMAVILVIDANLRLAMDYPDIEIEGEKQSGKAIENPNVTDVIHVLRGKDRMRSTNQFTQLHGFLKWYLEQEATEPETDDDDEFENAMWYSAVEIAKKWNEYVEKAKA